MLTYQLQRRYCSIKNHKPFSFPNDVEIEICLEPTEQFGIGTQPSLTAVQDSKNPKSIVNANTGRMWIVCTPPLNPIEAIFEWQNNLRLEMRGNKVCAKQICNTFQELEQLLDTLHYFMPILLNLEFAEPPIVKYTGGRIGETIFNWELQLIQQRFDITTTQKQEERVIKSFERMDTIAGVKNRRLAAALYYFYVARRLVEAGNSPYEFLSEVVLNLSKVLVILFSPKRDDVRSELLKFGYSKEEIEEKFIPIMILRNEFDVGHVSIALFTEKQLNALYKYLAVSEHDFRELLKRVADKVRSEEYTLQQDPDLSLGRDKRKTMERLIDTFEKTVSREE